MLKKKTLKLQIFCYLGFLSHAPKAMNSIKGVKSTRTPSGTCRLILRSRLVNSLCQHELVLLILSAPLGER